MKVSLANQQLISNYKEGEIGDLPGNATNQMVSQIIIISCHILTTLAVVYFLIYWYNLSKQSAHFFTKNKALPSSYTLLIDFKKQQVKSINESSVVEHFSQYGRV